MKSKSQLFSLFLIVNYKSNIKMCCCTPPRYTCNKLSYTSYLHIYIKSKWCESIYNYSLANIRHIALSVNRFCNFLYILVLSLTYYHTSKFIKRPIQCKKDKFKARQELYPWLLLIYFMVKSPCTSTHIVKNLCLKWWTSYGWLRYRLSYKYMA